MDGPDPCLGPPRPPSPKRPPRTPAPPGPSRPPTPLEPSMLSLPLRPPRSLVSPASPVPLVSGRSPTPPEPRTPVGPPRPSMSAGSPTSPGPQRCPVPLVPSGPAVPPRPAAPSQPPVPSPPPGAPRPVAPSPLPGAPRLQAPRQRLYRHTFTEVQVRRLEQFFQEAQYISQCQRMGLAAELNLDEYTVKLWFKNRRAKSSQEQKQAALKSNVTVASADSTSQVDPEARSSQLPGPTGPSSARHRVSPSYRYRGCPLHPVLIQSPMDRSSRPGRRPPRDVPQPPLPPDSSGDCLLPNRTAADDQEEDMEK